MNGYLMKRLTLTALLTALAAPPALAQEEVASWQFLQAVGGMKVGQPKKEADGWLLPVECDLTGLRRISVDPTVLNSSQVIKELRWNVQGDQLRLSILLKPTSYATSEARCGTLNLGAIPPKPYQVVYTDGEKTFPIGAIKFDSR